MTTRTTDSARTLAIALTLASLTGVASAEQKVRVPAPDRAHFGMAYLSLGPEGGESRTAAGVDLKAAWSPAIRIAGRSNGLAFWDSMYIDMAMGKVTSTPVMDESAIAIDMSAGYQLLAGWRTDTFAAMGGAGIDYGLTMVGEPSIGGLSFPLVGHGELYLGGDRKLAGTATAAFIGGRQQYGLDAMFRIHERWGVGASVAYIRGDEGAPGAGMTPTTSGFVSSLTVQIDRL